MEKVYAGIDISKDFFDVALPAAEKLRYLKLSNDKAGFKQLVKELKGLKDVVCVMEASGPYYLPLATYLHKKQIAVSVVNPLVVRHFAKTLLVRTKTDKKDAALLAAYGAKFEPAPWEPEAGHMLELKQLQTVMQGLQKSLHQHQRQLESLLASGRINQQAKKSLEQMIKQAKMELEKVEKQMDELIKTHYQSQYEQLKSIPGLGRKSSMLLIMISSGFTKFAHYKQLICYVGLNPRVYESGSSVRGKGKICKMGMSQVRKVLYVCSWSAIKCNKACRELYERLTAKGKAKKLALVAVAGKLLKQAFAVATKKEFYSEQYTEKLYQKTCF